MGRGFVNYDFQERLAFSFGEQRDTDLATIQAMIDGCVSVTQADEKLDRSGVDYIARLRRGAELLIDAKTRDRGCSKWWVQGVPELALETWSARPGGKFGIARDRAKVGWTLCEAKNVDLILFKFHPDDSRKVYLACFQLLRMAFRRNLGKWSGQFNTGVQSSSSWESECLFVPANVVYAAMLEASVGNLAGVR